MKAIKIITNRQLKDARQQQGEFNLRTQNNSEHRSLDNKLSTTSQYSRNYEVPRPEHNISRQYMVNQKINFIVKHRSQTAPLKYQRSLKNARYTSKDNQPNLAQSNAIVSITPPYKKIYANPRKRWQKPKCYTEFKVP